MTEQVQMTHYSSRKHNYEQEDSKFLALIQNNYFQKLLHQQSQTISNPDVQVYTKFLSKLGQFCTPCSICCHCCCSFPLYQQNTGQLGLLTHFGKYQQTVEPGLKIINPITEQIFSVNLRMQILINQQSIISKDNVQFKVETVIFYRIFSPTDTVYKLGKNMTQVAQFVAQISKSSLRQVAGSLEVQKIIQNRDRVGVLLKGQINRQVCIWGIIVDVSNIKQIWLPKDMLDVFSSVAVTKRRSQASIICAQANVESAKLLKQASQILDSKAAMQIRYLETVEQILEKRGDNIIFLKTNEKKQSNI